ncbi:hypothetical protein JCGZ_22910 [Jatropha curcas]|uniref:Formin-like protein n=1 Tax=Jatropha curcas TaxID=180498 RepID=A0A067K0U7_JATCU|nr:formin-like protein 3 [Jatropha curcas]KDP25880.1 hypothetical protein JCGZ_22910 [Jatropha curcas]
MELRKACYAFVLVILLCALNIGSKMRRREEMIYGNGCLQGDKQIVELACIHCKKVLVDRKDCFEGFDLHLPQEATTNLKSTYVHEAITLPFQLKQELLDCLRKKNLIFCVSAQGDSPTSWFIQCSELLFGWPSASRRYLDGESYGKTEPSSSKFVVRESAAASALSNSAATSSPSQNQLAHPFFEMKLNQQQDVNNLSPLRPHARKLRKRRKKRNIQKDLLIAVIATSLTTFCLVAALFICWLCMRHKNKKIAPSDEKRDEKPLLHLSDLSASPSQNSSALENSQSKVQSPCSNGKTTTNFETNPPVKNVNPASSLLELPSVEVNPGGALPPLKPPPGRPLSMKPAAPEIPAPEKPTPEKLTPEKPAPPAPPPNGPPAPPPPSAGPRAPPPPPPKGGRAPPAPPPKGKPVPPGQRRGPSDSSDKDNPSGSSGPSKTRLKPFFWDKVMASPDQSMVWHEISSGSFQFNEEMIESLFGYQAAVRSKSDRKKDSSESSIQYIQIIDARKAQNLSILLKALNVTSVEVLDALREGTELPVELVQTLLKMAPTQEEELKLRLFAGDLNQLGPAERFLKIVVEIPFAFKRMECLVFMTCFQEELSTLKESFSSLEVACDKLRNSRLFLKLLEAVLKTGNRMNVGTYRGGAQAFKLDTLLKLSDVKGVDGKTTLLHFVVQEIIRSEGIRAVRTARASQSSPGVKSEDLMEDSNQESEHYRNLGLKVVSGLSTELEDVRKAAAVDADVLTSTVSKLVQSLAKSKAFLGNEMKSLDEDSKFYHTVATFLDNADSEVSWVSKEEKRIMALVQNTADYFHGNAAKNEGLRLFTIVRDFLVMLDKACKDVKDDRAAMPMKTTKKETPALSDSPENRQQSDVRREKLFPAIAGKRCDYSSSDDESPSP